MSKSCDICGAAAEILEPLKSCYQTNGIKEVCYKCLSKIDNQNSKLMTIALKMKRTWLKQFMINLKSKFSKPKESICPVCGYYCFGKKGLGCIDKNNWEQGNG